MRGAIQTKTGVLNRHVDLNTTPLWGDKFLNTSAVYVSTVHTFLT